MNTWLELLISGKVKQIWSIGQLDKAALASLRKATKKGTLVQSREHWSGYTVKTVWRLNEEKRN